LDVLKKIEKDSGMRQWNETKDKKKYYDENS
jgi:hypothetical protein